MKNIHSEYFENPIVGAYIVIPYPVKDEGKTIEEMSRILPMVKSASANCVWVIIYDLNMQSKILDYILDKANSLNLKVVPVLQPYVSITEHPEVKVVNADGTTADDPRYLNIGCFNHPLLRETARRLAEDFVKRYGGHPALYRIGGLPLIGFVHESYYRNDVPEFGGGPLKPCCYCKYCKEKFREAMREKYGSIERFNKRHGTSYESWEALEPPRDPSNPTLWKEWLDFHAEIIPDYLKEMIEHARRLMPVLATHELNDFYPCTYQCVYSGNDIWRMARVIDVGHEDMYPMEFDHRYVIYVYEYIKDLVRSAMGFSKLYTANGQCFYSWLGYKIPPSSMFEQVYSCLIHGALGLVWWVDWRKPELWAETRRPNEEYAKLVRELKDYYQPKPEVALLYSWTSMEMKLNDLFSMDNLLFYTLLARSSLPVDLVSEQQVEEGILEKRGYKVLCAVGCPTLPPEVAVKIREFVEKGGVLIQDYAGEAVGEFKQVYPELVLEERRGHDVYRVETSIPTLKSLNGRFVPVYIRDMCETIDEKRVDEVVARFEDGSPAIALAKRGEGFVVKAATMLGWDYTNYPGYYDLAVMFPFVIRWCENLRELVTGILKWAGVSQPAASSNPAVEVGVWKRADGKRLMVLAVNHLNEPSKTTITLLVEGGKPYSVTDFFTGERIDFDYETDRSIRFDLSLDNFKGKAIVVELK